MSPERARIFIAEDNISRREQLKKFLEGTGHEVVLEAGTFEDTIASIEEAKEKGVNVALVDGSLALEPPLRPDHGVRITKALREAIPDIKVISISASSTDYGDIQLRPGEGPHIGKIIDEL